jgi:hypothetical protein
MFLIHLIMKLLLSLKVCFLIKYISNDVFSFCLSDDLELSPDFLDYFQALYPLLVHDKSLWCISAWNDNGIDRKIAREPS